MLHKNIAYLQDVNKTRQDSLSLTIKDYHLQPNDILFIDVKSDYQFQNNVLSLNNNNSGNFFTKQSLYYTGYTVDKNGNITIPVIGSVFVQNKTIAEVQKEIELKANNIIKDAYVSVKLINFNISILGEVQKPGTYSVYEGENSVYQLIAKAGDLTDYANRRDILILRKNNEKLITNHINLTNKEILADSDYFLMPNDIIYVEPVKSKGFRIFASDYAVVLSTITSTLTAILLITNFKFLK